MSQLICYDCHTFKRVVVYVLDDRKRIVGARCKKCVQKLYVKGEKSTFGRGWKVRFMDLVEAIRDQQRRQKNPAVKVPAVAVPKEQPSKLGIRDHISNFFQRRTM